MRQVVYVLPLTMIGLMIVLASQLGTRGFEPPRSEAEIALAFACGYRAGQVAITSRLPSLFTKPEDSEQPKGSCVALRDLAARRGFTTGVDR